MKFSELVKERIETPEAEKILKKIKSTKKGDNKSLEKLDKELSKLHRDRDITSPEFNELEAMVGRLYESELNEASPISIGDVPQKIMVQIDELKKVFGKFKIDLDNLHDGIHGIITGIELPNVMGTPRLEIKDLQTISKLKGLRWVEFEEQYMTIGWKH